MKRRISGASPRTLSKRIAFTFQDQVQDDQVVRCLVKCSDRLASASGCQWLVGSEALVA